MKKIVNPFKNKKKEYELGTQSLYNPAQTNPASQAMTGQATGSITGSQRSLDAQDALSSLGGVGSAIGGGINFIGSYMHGENQRQRDFGANRARMDEQASMNSQARNFGVSAEQQTDAVTRNQNLNSLDSNRQKMFEQGTRSFTPEEQVRYNNMKGNWDKQKKGGQAAGTTRDSYIHDTLADELIGRQARNPDQKIWHAGRMKKGNTYGDSEYQGNYSIDLTDPNLTQKENDARYTKTGSTMYNPTKVQQTQLRNIPLTLDTKIPDIGPLNLKSDFSPSKISNDDISTNDINSLPPKEKARALELIQKNGSQKDKDRLLPRQQITNNNSNNSGNNKSNSRSSGGINDNLGTLLDLPVQYNKEDDFFINPLDFRKWSNADLQRVGTPGAVYSGSHRMIENISPVQSAATSGLIGSLSQKLQGSDYYKKDLGIAPANSTFRRVGSVDNELHYPQYLSPREKDKGVDTATNSYLSKLHKPSLKLAGTAVDSLQKFMSLSPEDKVKMRAYHDKKIEEYRRYNKDYDMSTMETLKEMGTSLKDLFTTKTETTTKPATTTQKKRTVTTTTEDPRKWEWTLDWNRKNDPRTFTTKTKEFIDNVVTPAVTSSKTVTTKQLNDYVKEKAAEVKPIIPTNKKPVDLKSTPYEFEFPHTSKKDSFDDLYKDPIQKKYSDIQKAHVGGLEKALKDKFNSPKVAIQKVNASTYKLKNDPYDVSPTVFEHLPVISKAVQDYNKENKKKFEQGTESIMENEIEGAGQAEIEVEKDELIFRPFGSTFQLVEDFKGGKTHEEGGEPFVAQEGDVIFPGKLREEILPMIDKRGFIKHAYIDEFLDIRESLPEDTPEGTQAQQAVSDEIIGTGMNFDPNQPPQMKCGTKKLEQGTGFLNVGPVYNDPNAPMYPQPTMIGSAPVVPGLNIPAKMTPQTVPDSMTRPATSAGADAMAAQQYAGDLNPANDRSINPYANDPEVKMPLTGPGLGQPDPAKQIAKPVAPKQQKTQSEGSNTGTTSGSYIGTTGQGGTDFMGRMALDQIAASDKSKKNYQSQYKQGTKKVRMYANGTKSIRRFDLPTYETGTTSFDFNAHKKKADEAARKFTEYYKSKAGKDYTWKNAAGKEYKIRHIGKETRGSSIDPTGKWHGGSGDDWYKHTSGGYRNTNNALKEGFNSFGEFRDNFIESQGISKDAPEYDIIKSLPDDDDGRAAMLDMIQNSGSPNALLKYDPNKHVGDDSSKTFSWKGGKGITVSGSPINVNQKGDIIENEKLVADPKLRRIQQTTYKDKIKTIDTGTDARKRFYSGAQSGGISGHHNAGGKGKYTIGADGSINYVQGAAGTINNYNNQTMANTQTDWNLGGGKGGILSEEVRNSAMTPDIKAEMEAERQSNELTRKAHNADVDAFNSSKSTPSSQDISAEKQAEIDSRVSENQSNIDLAASQLEANKEKARAEARSQGIPESEIEKQVGAKFNTPLPGSAIPKYIKNMDSSGLPASTDSKYSSDSEVPLEDNIDPLTGKPKQELRQGSRKFHVPTYRGGVKRSKALMEDSNNSVGGNYQSGDGNSINSPSSYTGATITQGDIVKADNRRVMNINSGNDYGRRNTFGALPMADGRGTMSETGEMGYTPAPKTSFREAMRSLREDAGSPISSSETVPTKTPKVPTEKEAYWAQKKMMEDGKARGYNIDTEEGQAMYQKHKRVGDLQPKTRLNNSQEFLENGDLGMEVKSAFMDRGKKIGYGGKAFLRRLLTNNNHKMYEEGTRRFELPKYKSGTQKLKEQEQKNEFKLQKMNLKNELQHSKTGAKNSAQALKNDARAAELRFGPKGAGQGGSGGGNVKRSSLDQTNSGNTVGGDYQTGDGNSTSKSDYFTGAATTQGDIVKADNRRIFNAGSAPETNKYDVKKARAAASGMPNMPRTSKAGGLGPLAYHNLQNTQVSLEGKNYRDLSDPMRLANKNTTMQQSAIASQAGGGGGLAGVMGALAQGKEGEMQIESGEAGNLQKTMDANADIRNQQKMTQFQQDAAFKAKENDNLTDYVSANHGISTYNIGLQNQQEGRDMQKYQMQASLAQRNKELQMQEDMQNRALAAQERMTNTQAVSASGFWDNPKTQTPVTPPPPDASTTAPPSTGVAGPDPYTPVKPEDARTPLAPGTMGMNMINTLQTMKPNTVTGPGSGLGNSGSMGLPDPLVKKRKGTKKFIIPKYNK